jgi:hypothetical protein
MSTNPNMARKWTCDGCGVSAGRIDGAAIPLPNSWTSAEGGQFCLVCRRERAAEAAVESAPPDSSSETRANLRRAALIEFEVRRTPDQTNGVIAKACRSSVTAVSKARQRLRLPDPPSAVGGRSG